MTLRLPLRVLALALALPAAPAWSLDLMGAWQLARENDAVFQAARATAEAAREALPQARAQLLPNIGLSGSRSRNATEQIALGTDRPPVDYDYSAKSYALSVRQPLLRMQQVYQYRQAGAQVAAAEETLGHETLKMGVRAATAYFDALITRERLGSLRAQIEFYQAQLAQAERSFALGLGTRTDIEDARARHDMAVAREIEARNNVIVTERVLSAVVGRPVRVDELVPLDPARLAAPPLDGLDAWIARAEAANPELAALRHSLEAAEREVDRVRAGHYPTVDLVATRSLSSSENNYTIGSEYRTSSLGVQVNIPLYAGGGVDAAVRQAIANRDRVRHQVEAARRQIAVNVTQEFSAATFGVSRVRALEQALESARQAVIGSEKGVLGGVRNAVDVLNAQQQLFATRAELTDARHAFVLAFLRLKAAAGGLDEDDLRTVNTWLAL